MIETINYALEGQLKQRLVWLRHQSVKTINVTIFLQSVFWWSPAVCVDDAGGQSWNYYYNKCGNLDDGDDDDAGGQFFYYNKCGNLFEGKQSRCWCGQAQMPLRFTLWSSCVVLYCVVLCWVVLCCIKFCCCGAQMPPRFTLWSRPQCQRVHALRQPPTSEGFSFIPPFHISNTNKFNLINNHPLRIVGRKVDKSVLTSQLPNIEPITCVRQRNTILSFVIVDKIQSSKTSF